MPNVLKLVDFWKVILWTGAFLALIYKAEIIYKDYSKNLYHLKLHGRKNSARQWLPVFREHLLYFREPETYSLHLIPLLNSP